MRWSAARAVMTASGDTEVSLFYERPLRDFLSGGSRRKERLSLPSDQPFETLRHAVYKRLDADVPLELKHAKGSPPTARTFLLFFSLSARVRRNFAESGRRKFGSRAKTAFHNSLGTRIAFVRKLSTRVIRL